jgi:carboxypeptidase family protein
MTSPQSRWGRRILCSLATLFVMSSLVSAQDYRGKVQGVVTDTGSATLSNARVVLRNDGTGVEVPRQTDAEGRYIFDFVESGIYTIIVEAQNFKRFEQRNITVQNRADVTVDAHLEVGGLTEVITVQDSPTAVQFNSSNTALTIETKLVDQMPIRGRNPYNLSTLDPTINGGTLHLWLLYCAPLALSGEILQSRQLILAHMRY